MADSPENSRLSGEYWNIARERESRKCVFCDLKDKYIISKGKHSTLTVNLFPYTNGQLLVIPERHVVDFSELTPDEILDVHSLTQEGLDLLKRNLKIDNVWVILRNGDVAGKTVKHLHWNILPYVEGINTWHYQEITIPPVDLAKILKREK